MRFDILSLFPEYFDSPFRVSLLKRAQERQLLSFHFINIRDFSTDKHKKVDGRPYGGGPGMVLMAQPVCSAIRSVKNKGSHVIYLSPQGKLFTSTRAEALAKKEHLILLCGHYEGIDERIVEKEVDEELSIGNFVLTNGCIAAIVLIDAVARFIPGVLGNEKAAYQDSFQNGVFDTPHYTRPRVFEDSPVPEVLMTGHHGAIEMWGKARALDKTARVRPELYRNHLRRKISKGSKNETN